jgi:hypothetical protein
VQESVVKIFLKALANPGKALLDNSTFLELCLLRWSEGGIPRRGNFSGETIVPKNAQKLMIEA